MHLKHRYATFSGEDDSMKALLLIIIALALLSRAASAETIASATLRVTLAVPEKPISIHFEPGQYKSHTIAIERNCMYVTTR